MSGRRSPAAQRAARDARIVAAAERGESTIAIAEREQLSDRQVRRVLAATAGGPQSAVGVAVRERDDATEPLSINPFEIRREAIHTHLESLETLRALARDSRQPAVRCGAARAAVSASGSLIVLLERLGFAPTSPDSWLSEQAWALVWREMRAALTAAGVTDLAAFAEDVARRVGHAVPIGDGDVQLVGLGPEFVPRAAA